MAASYLQKEEEEVVFSVSAGFKEEVERSASNVGGVQSRKHPCKSTKPVNTTDKFKEYRFGLNALIST